MRDRTTNPKGKTKLTGHNKPSEGDKFAEFINSNGPLTGAIIAIAFIVCLVISIILNL